MQPERYVWAQYFWEQARDANGVARRHLGDTTRNNGAPTVGSPFVALCGIDVTPHPEDTDTARGTCFAPACMVCTTLFACTTGWSAGAIGNLIQTFQWTNNDVRQLGLALGMTASQTRRQIEQWTQEADKVNKARHTAKQQKAAGR